MAALITPFLHIPEYGSFWYNEVVQRTPSQTRIQNDLMTARLGVEAARATRQRLRRRSAPGGQREGEIHVAVAATLKANKPIRRYLGMLRYHSLPLVDADRELREVSRALQYERGQLRKMLR